MLRVILSTGGDDSDGRFERESRERKDSDREGFISLDWTNRDLKRE